MSSSEQLQSLRSLYDLPTTKESHPVFLIAQPCSIAQLPVEILGRIFNLCRCPDKERYRAGDCLTPLLAVTHVCSHWRDVALSSAYLWTGISVHNESLMEAMLARSKELPISLVMDNKWGTGQVNGDRLAVACTRHHIIPRIKELRYLGFSLHPFLETVFEKEANLLESLTFVSHLHYNPPRPNDLALFLGTAFPRLKKLKLVRCCVGWQSPLLFSPSLTELKIYCELQTLRPSLSQIHDVLSSLPGLMTLVLVDVVRTRKMESMQHPDTALSPIPALGDASKVALSQLRSLRFSTETPVDIRDFLSILDTPSDTVLHIRFRSLDGSLRLDGQWDDLCTPPEVTLHNIVHSILQSFAPSSCPPVALQHGRAVGYRSVGILSTSLVHDTTDPNDFCVVVGNHDRSTSDEAIPLQDAPSWHRQTDSPNFPPLEHLPVWDTRFFLGLPFEALSHSRWVLPVTCRLFPLRGVDTVFVNSPVFSDAELWWLTFGFMEHVTTVVVSGDAVCGFAAALRGKGRPSTPFIYDDLDTSHSNISGEEVSSKERWASMIARPLPAFIDGLELPSQLFPNLLHLQVESLSADKPVLELPNVLEDLTAGMEELMMNRGLWNRADTFPAGGGPLFTLNFKSIGPGKVDLATFAELQRRSSLSRFIRVSPDPQNHLWHPSQADEPCLWNEDSMHWLARQGGSLRDDDYF
ncbi:hypothetical protein BV25DRAFT_1922218 [Artomyces pyxidatus]|uniref:Uncharacterized protein n=1 Tax=Artomyces pyxidatus TaxID=48021 RepID=A0ACB8SG99_9AGAM|nr:hypothetical protein BV25DRAFT_1922218 [Artomyces pyxidatus]